MGPCSARAFSSASAGHLRLVGLPRAVSHLEQVNARTNLLDCIHPHRVREVPRELQEPVLGCLAKVTYQFPPSESTMAPRTTG
jgi:hypothetical protein